MNMSATERANNVAFLKLPKREVPKFLYRMCWKEDNGREIYAYTQFIGNYGKMPANASAPVQVQVSDRLYDLAGSNQSKLVITFDIPHPEEQCQTRTANKSTVTH